MSSHLLGSRNIDPKEGHTQFGGSEVDNRQPEQFQCPSTEPHSVGHEQDDNENHSQKVDRTQTPADGHGEKEICREGNFNIVAGPASIANTNTQLQEILASIQCVKQSVREANEIN
jgi:hypothetical protein